MIELSVLPERLLLSVLFAQKLLQYMLPAVPGTASTLISSCLEAWLLLPYHQCELCGFLDAPLHSACDGVAHRPP